MKRINLLKGNYGNSNTGDDLLAYSINKSFEFYGLKTTVLWNENVEQPFEFESISFPVVHGKRLHKLVLLVSYSINSKSIIFGGGSQLQLSFGILNILILVFCMKILKKKVVFHSIGIDVLSNRKHYRTILSQIIKCSDYFSVRDLRSQQIAHQISKRKKVYLSSDPCILLKDYVRASNGNPCLLKPRNYLSILVVPMDYEILYRVVDSLIDTLSPSKDRVLRFTILPFANVDTYAVNELQKFINSKNVDFVEVISVQFTNDISKIISIFESSDLVVSGRLHGGVFGAVFTKPVLFCANYERNIGHNLNLGLSIGYCEENFVTEKSDVNSTVKDFVSEPTKFIRNNDIYETAKQMLYEDISRISKILNDGDMK